MINDLASAAHVTSASPARRHPNGLPRRSGAKAGWTPGRRARQAAAIRRWQPWRRSTGPQTDAGKARVAANALRHGYRSRAWIERAKRIRRAIRLCAQTVLLVRVLREQERRSQIESLRRSGAPRYASGSPFTCSRNAKEPLRGIDPRPTPPT